MNTLLESDGIVTFGLCPRSESKLDEEMICSSSSGVEEASWDPGIEVDVRRLKRIIDICVAVAVLTSVNRSKSRRKKIP